MFIKGSLYGRVECRIITEKLMGECWHEVPLFSEICRKCKKLVAVVHPSRVISINRNICESDAKIRIAREKIAEKGLQKEFINALCSQVFTLQEQISANFDWFTLLHATPEQQARAIVAVLEIEE